MTERTDERADVVVAGGGIVGLALAWRLQEAGLATWLLEAGRLGGSTSAGTFAWVNATAKTGDEPYHRLNAAGLAAWQALADAQGAETIGLYGQGSLQWVSASDRGLHAQLQADHSALEGYGYPVQWMDRAAMRARVPVLEGLAEDAEGLLAPADRWLEVPRFLAWAEQRFLALGGRIRTERPLGAIERDAEGRLAAVLAPGLRIATDRLVLTAGAETGRLLGRLLDRLSGGAAAGDSLPLKEVPGFLLETRPLETARRLDLVLWSPDEAGFHLRPTAAGGLLLGADDVDAVVGEGEDQHDIDRARVELLARASLWLPGLGRDHAAAGATWRIGRRAVPVDGHSIVGPIAAVPGLHVSVTHSGVTLAPRLGALLAEGLASGRLPAALAQFSPARFGL